VSDNDCAAGIQSQFDSTADRIYVVATAVNIRAGMRLESIWTQGGVEVVRHDFTPEFEINGNCIWFFVDQTDFVFTPGSYAVQLTIDGAASGPPLSFTISGNAMPEATAGA
jgi:hypothetical protein